MEELWLTMSISSSELRLFPQLKNNINPHLALCDATSRIYLLAENLESTKSLFRSVIDKGGIGFEYSCAISCTFDYESMEALGIEKFENMDRCVVGTDEREFVWMIYSMAELEGWLTLLALSISEKIDNGFKRPLIKMLDRRFDTITRLSDLYPKLSGDVDWDYGPTGRHNTPEFIKQWKTMHSKDVADEYFSCVEPDFVSSGFSFSDEQDSPYSSAPSKERLFPTLSPFENPHKALFSPLEVFLYRYENSDELIAALESLIDGNGCDFADIGKIYCAYDDMLMKSDGIKEFENGERWIVKTNDESDLKWFMYSREEIEGWVSLVAVNLAKKRIIDRKRRLDELFNPRFDQANRLAHLKKKLSGEEGWKFDPLGINANDSAVIQWKNLHCPGLAEDIFSYGRSGLVAYRGEHDSRPLSKPTFIISNSGGLSGGYNRSNFLQALDNPFHLDPPVPALRETTSDPICDSSGRIIGERVTYQLPIIENGSIKLDSSGRKTYARENSTCLYNPDVFSDTEMITFSKEAGELAYKKYYATMLRASNENLVGVPISLNGLNYRVYLNKIDGRIVVTDVHLT